MSTPKPTILLVDDDIDLRETLTDGLEHAGYDVIQAGNLRNLLGRLPSLKPSVIIVDLMLSGDTGATLLGYIKAHPRLKTIKCIMMSGYEHAEETAAMWNADLFLRKPVTITILLAALKKVGIDSAEIRA